MKALVTGGAGFIGSNLALELERKGCEVTVIDNLFSGSDENLNGFTGKVVHADVSHPFELREKYEIIFHQAALTDPRYGNDAEMVRANTEGFKNILEHAGKSNSKLVYASSASMYGNGPVPMKEDQRGELLNTYAKSKLQMEKMAEKYSHEMHLVGLRYFNVFGPREAHKGRPASMIFHLSRHMKAGKAPRIFKYGEQKRDHIYVKDVVDATILAADAKQSGVCNVGTGIATDFNELVALLNDALGTELDPEYIDNPYGETYQKNTQADTKKAEQFLGFKARWKLKDAITDYMEWLDE